jgi:hypothetical protein
VNLAGTELARIELVASHPRFAIPMYTGTHVRVEIDGELSKCSWGEHAFDLAPGRHMLAVGYDGFNNHGLSEWIWVDVQAGATARVTYRAPSRGTQTGTLESDHAVAPPDDLPEDLSDLSDEQLIEAWNDFKELAGRDPIKRWMLRKMRSEFEQELKNRGLEPKSIGFER